MPEVDFWVIPIIQGFVQVEELVVNYNETSDEERSSPETPPQEVTCVDDIHPRFTVALISRRSRHRPGRATVLVNLAQGTLNLNSDLAQLIHAMLINQDMLYNLMYNRVFKLGDSVVFGYDP